MKARSNYTACRPLVNPSFFQGNVMRLSLSLVAAALLLIAMAGVTPASAQTVFKDLLQQVPEDANAIALINADKLRASAFVREFNAKTLRGSSQSHQYIVPREEIDRVVLAAELNQQLNPQWEVAVVKTNTSFSLLTLASEGHGKEEKLGKSPALQLPNAFLIEFEPKTYGVFGPVNRQKAMRWAERSQAAREVRLSPYLSKIAEYPETAGTEVMLGLDLAGMVDLGRVRDSLKRSVVLKGHTRVDQEKLAQLLAGLQGIALGVKATDDLNGKLRVDFGSDPSSMQDFAKPLLLEKLGDLGLMIDDLERWEPSIQGKTLYLSGTLSPGGLRQVLSLIDPPSLPASAPTSKDIPSASELDPLALSSQRYFREISGMLTDMSKRENLKYAKQFSWYDKYARKISQLSMVNVDPDLLDYGLATSTALRSMAYNLRNQAAEASQYSNNRETTWNAYGDWYNGYLVTYHTAPSEREKAEKMSKMYGTMSYADTVQNIGNLTAETRRRMVERYKIEF